MRSVSQIILSCGRAKAISERSQGKLSLEAIYKWKINGIPDRHWSLVMSLCATSPDELFAANEALRNSEMHGEVVAT